jgi:hypothetical protein
MGSFVIPVGRARGNPIPPVSTAHIGHPRIAIYHIGGRSESNSWQDAAWLERLSVCDELTLNFAAFDSGHAAASVATIRSWNNNIRIIEYRNYSDLLQSSATDLARQAYVEANFVTPALPGGTAADGMARTPAGAYVSGWPNKLDINVTDFPNTFNGQIPATYVAMEEYNEWFTGAFANTFDDITYDIWRWYARYSDKQVDFNRDGKRYDESDPTHQYENFDPDGAMNSAYIRGKIAIHDAIQEAALIDRGSYLPILGELSWTDHFEGGRADSDVIMPSDIPQSMINITEGGNMTGWSKKMGYDGDGSVRPSGNFERGYKLAQREVAWCKVSPRTETVRMLGHIELPASFVDEAAYCAGALVMAGAYVTWFTRSDWRTPAELDEFFGTDLSTLSTAEKIDNMHWMGNAIGPPPEFGQSFIDGVRGGILEKGVMGREFDNGFLLLNPKGNGQQTIAEPPNGPWKKIAGGQRATNDGSLIGPSLTIPDERALFLKTAP